MNRRVLGARLAILVATTGLIPIALVGLVGLRTLRDRAVADAEDNLSALAQQVAERVRTYQEQQRELVRALAANLPSDADAGRRLEEVPLDAPSLGRIVLLDRASPHELFPPQIDGAGVRRAFAGEEVQSRVYLTSELTPALDLCVPARGLPGRAVCAALNLLELQRLVQRVHLGKHGYALAFDPQGRVIASGAGELRAAVLTGEPIAESPAAAQLARGGPAPHRMQSSLGEDMLVGWAQLPGQEWIIAAEQPAEEALAPGTRAQVALAVTAVMALLTALLVGLRQSRRMLTALEGEERWRAAGRIASGISHDLGHRLAILQQTAALAQTGDAGFLPVIRDNLRAEVATLQRFVGDFADLSRDVKPGEFVALELNAFAESVRRSAAPLAERAGVLLELELPARAPWVRADRYLLERAALNLVTNGIEASPAGSLVTLRIGDDRPLLRAQIEVRDRGVGIEAERQESIFSSFVSTKRTGAHVGMGLANVHRIVLAHGGAVSLKSEQGCGAAFTISLPLAERPA